MIGVLLDEVLREQGALLGTGRGLDHVDCNWRWKGAAIAGRPDGLARALEKLGAYSRSRVMDANPSTAHMFIVNPLAGQKLTSLFSTHPPLEERVARLTGARPSAPPSSSGPGGRQSDGAAFWDRLSE